MVKVIIKDSVKVLPEEDRERISKLVEIARESAGKDNVKILKGIGEWVIYIGNPPLIGIYPERNLADIVFPNDDLWLKAKELLRKYETLPDERKWTLNVYK